MKTNIASFIETTENKRFDAQFFWPEYVNSFNKISTLKTDKLSDISHITDGNHLKIADDFDNEKGVRYLRGQDLGRDMMINDRNIIYIPDSAFEDLKRSHIFTNDILITIVGANTGLVGLVHKAPKKLVANCKLGISRADTTKILPGYLYTFLSSKYGQDQILRAIRGGGQTGLVLPDMRDLLIVRFSEDFEEKIHNAVMISHTNYFEPKSMFEEAQRVIDEELNQRDYSPKHDLSFVHSFSDVSASGRIDADYYQPKYIHLQNVIKSHRDGYSTLQDCLTIKDSNFKVDPDSEYTYIELSNISKDGEISDCKKMKGRLLPSRAKRLVKTGDVIVSSVEGSLSSIAIIDDKLNNAICSTGFYVLSSNELYPETIYTFLKSKYGQMQLKKGCSGTILTAINKPELHKVLVPKFSNESQAKISSLYKKANLLRISAKKTIDECRKAIELAVLVDEKKGISHLEVKGIIANA